MPSVVYFWETVCFLFTFHSALGFVGMYVEMLLLSLHRIITVVVIDLRRTEIKVSDRPSGFISIFIFSSAYYIAYQALELFVLHYSVGNITPYCC